MMFQPSHFLVSRSRKTPVQLVAHTHGLQLLTEAEFLQGTAAAFEMRPHLGVFCKGVPVIGYNLEPMAAPISREAPQTSESRR